ncbi:MAG: hypothetical protein GXO18_00610 [Aquificae bacterium]|nr:hypothetical protein [Aquificota bacterium]
MEEDRLRQLLERLLNGNISEREYKALASYLAGMLKGVAEGIALERGKETNILNLIGRRLPQGENVLGYLVEELFVHILSKRERFKNLLDGNQKLKAYLATTVRNFLYDTFNKLNRSVETVLEDDIKTGDPQEDADRTLSGSNMEVFLKDVRRVELLELEELVSKLLKKEEFKYLCYKLDSKRYKCLWEGRSDDAVYQDFRRKGREVMKKLAKAFREANVREELFEKYTKIYLSELCEKLRSEICKGDEK